MLPPAVPWTLVVTFKYQVSHFHSLAGLSFALPDEILQSSLIEFVRVRYVVFLICPHFSPQDFCLPLVLPPNFFPHAGTPSLSASEGRSRGWASGVPGLLCSVSVSVDPRW